MTPTLQDFRDTLKDQHRADEAIFWFCHFWHSGKDSPLYQIMREVVRKSDMMPRLHTQKQVNADPEMQYAWMHLKNAYEKAYGPMREYQLRRVNIADVEEGDILVHCRRPVPNPMTGRYPKEYVCIVGGWPCVVYRHRGDLGVACAEGPKGASFHALKWDSKGTVRGFWR